MHRNLDLIARGQHGAFAYEQAREAGFSKTQIRTRRTKGLWLPAASGTFVLAGSPDTRERRVIVAVLAGGENAAASHTTAAWLRGFLERFPDVIDVTIPYERRGPDGARYHRSRTLDVRDINRVRNIPTTSVPRTLLDCTARLPRENAEAIVDEALLSRVATCDSVLRYLARRGLETVPGAGRLRDILVDRTDGALNKELERRFDRLLRSSKLPYPVRQHPFREFKIDFSYPELKIAIELDGVRTHGSAAALHYDLARQNALALDKWLILRFDWKRVTREGMDVLSEIEQALVGRAGRGI